VDQAKSGMRALTAVPSTAIEHFQPIAHLPMRLTAELDRRAISFGDLLAMNIGSVLHLSRPTGENVDLYIENVLLGSGEILLVDSIVAVRVADLRDKPSPEMETAAPPRNQAEAQAGEEGHK